MGFHEWWESRAQTQSSTQQHRLPGSHKACKSKEMQLLFFFKSCNNTLFMFLAQCHCWYSELLNRNLLLIFASFSLLISFHHGSCDSLLFSAKFVNDDEWEVRQNHNHTTPRISTERNNAVWGLFFMISTSSGFRLQVSLYFIFEVKKYIVQYEAALQTFGKKILSLWLNLFIVSCGIDCFWILIEIS